MTLVLALSYSSKKEVTQAIKNIVKKVENGDLNSDEINEDTIQNHLYTHNIPDPELLIRTSGEQRISNFLLWQIAYSELYFTDILWPDFRRENLYEAIVNYQKRERRFGKTSEQIEKENA
jgi:undecaprenyl diphosphate synthase